MTRYAGQKKNQRKEGKQQGTKGGRQEVRRRGRKKVRKRKKRRVSDASSQQYFARAMCSHRRPTGKTNRRKHLTWNLSARQIAGTKSGRALTNGCVLQWTEESSKARQLTHVGGRGKGLRMLQEGLVPGQVLLFYSETASAVGVCIFSLEVYSLKNTGGGPPIESCCR